MEKDIEEGPGALWEERGDHLHGPGVRRGHQQRLGDRAVHRGEPVLKDQPGGAPAAVRGGAGGTGSDPSDRLHPGPGGAGRRVRGRRRLDPDGVREGGQQKSGFLGAVRPRPGQYAPGGPQDQPDGNAGDLWLPDGQFHRDQCAEEHAPRAVDQFFPGLPAAAAVRNGRGQRVF